MKHDELERLLSTDDVIVPSSGFTAAVMNAVRREAATPPPIAFPWKRALPGVVGATFALIAALASGVRALIEHLQLASHTFERVFAGVIDIATSSGLNGLAVATLMVTLVVVTSIPTLLSEQLLRRCGETRTN